MRLNLLFKCLVVVSFLSTMVGCATLTPEKIAKRVDTMNDFDLCLASSAEMDKFTFVLPDEIVQAAKERIASKKIDCASKQDEIVRFLVRSLRDQERRNEQFRTHFGFGVMRFW